MSWISLTFYEEDKLRQELNNWLSSNVSKMDEYLLPIQHTFFYKYRGKDLKRIIETIKQFNLDDLICQDIIVGNSRKTIFLTIQSEKLELLFNILDKEYIHGFNHFNGYYIPAITVCKVDNKSKLDINLKNTDILKGFKLSVKSINFYNCKDELIYII